MTIVSFKITPKEFREPRGLLKKPMGINAKTSNGSGFSIRKSWSFTLGFDNLIFLSSLLSIRTQVAD